MQFLIERSDSLYKLRAKLHVLDLVGQRSLRDIEQIKEVSYLVRILAWSWHLDRAGPVVVEMAQGEGQGLNFVPVKRRLISGHVEVSWGRAALSRDGWCEVEIELLARVFFFGGLCQTFVNDATRRRVL